MFVRIILFTLFILVLIGCATSSTKQVAQSQPIASQKAYQEEPYSQGYGLLDNHEMPAQKTYSEPTIRLSAKQIQRALRDAGFYQGPIDGKIGFQTKEAIKKFQKAKGLKADGIVGKRTLLALNKYLSKGK